jgi:hypothetical protein
MVNLGDKLITIARKNNDFQKNKFIFGGQFVLKNNIIDDKIINQGH